MKITDAQAILISIPLRKPTSMSNKTVTAQTSSGFWFER